MAMITKQYEPAAPMEALCSRLDGFLPDQHVASVLDVNWAELAEQGITTVVTDLDSCVVEYGGFGVRRSIRQHFAAAREQGMDIIIATNTKIKTADDVIRLHNISRQLGATLTLVPYDYSQRKPTEFMPRQAQQQYAEAGRELDLLAAVMIGDKSSDMRMAEAGGIGRRIRVAPLGHNDHPGDRWLRRPIIERAVGAMGLSRSTYRKPRPPVMEQPRLSADRQKLVPAIPDLPGYILNDTSGLGGLGPIIGIQRPILETDNEPTPQLGWRAVIACPLVPATIKERGNKCLSKHGVKIGDTLTDIRPKLAALTAGLLITEAVVERFVNPLEHPALARVGRVAGKVAIGTSIATDLTDLDGQAVRRQVGVDMKSPERVIGARRDAQADKFAKFIRDIGLMISGRKKYSAFIAQTARALYSDRVQRPHWITEGYDTSACAGAKNTTVLEDVVGQLQVATKPGTRWVESLDDLSTVAKWYSTLVNAPIVWKQRKTKEHLAAYVRQQYEG